MTKTAVHTVYRLADGTRVPSVTTYLSVLGKPAIIHWAWKMGCEGLDYRKVRDEAGEIGTLAHYLIMCQLKGMEPDVTEYSEDIQTRAATCLVKFDAWMKEHIVEPVLVEEYLVSEIYGFGGTSDFYGLVDGVPTLVDFKTSGGIYEDYFPQVAAYEVLLKESGYLVDNVRILRIGRNEDEGFEDQTITNREPAWELFLHCQAIYELKKQIKKSSW